MLFPSEALETESDPAGKGETREVSLTAGRKPSEPRILEERRTSEREGAAEGEMKEEYGNKVAAFSIPKVYEAWEKYKYALHKL